MSYAAADARLREWIYSEQVLAIRSMAFCLGRCLREAAGFAMVESRLLASFAAPLVVRIDAADEPAIADRLRAMSGVGQVARAYKRCRYKYQRGNAAAHPTGTRCALEEGHAGGHNPYLPSEEELS